ncbi:MAG: c-type cytochrome biogenesis protein CcsB [Clostridia bacterium]|nr:c-type cytochrome biogenesis protein CcsB [Clostridia bacterium]
MNVLLFASLILYFAASVLQFLAVAAKKDFLHRIARWVMAAGFLSHTAFTVWRGFAAGRLPLANQFEFASAFAWAVTLMGFLLYRKLGQEGVLTIAMPAAFLILSYAAFQPREIKELMPALRSVWFGLHIGSAAFSYAAFAIAGGLGVGYLMKFRKVADQQDPGLKQMDYLAYRMICLGFLLLTVVIFSGAIWAEQAWSSWWSWDPKETWALITWIFYAIYLHQRLRLKWQGKRMAVLAIVALVLVLFTFAGVNLLLPGLHSYASNG